MYTVLLPYVCVCVEIGMHELKTRHRNTTIIMANPALSSPIPATLPSLPSRCQHGLIAVHIQVVHTAYYIRYTTEKNIYIWKSFVFDML